MATITTTLTNEYTNYYYPTMIKLVHQVLNLTPHFNNKTVLCIHAAFQKVYCTAIDISIQHGIRIYQPQQCNHCQELFI